MNRKFPKQFITLNGKPLFIYGLEVLAKCDEIDRIIMACDISNLNKYVIILEEYGIENVNCIAGGNTRQESVFNSLQFVKTENVLIHEAARPLISTEFVHSIINTEITDAVIPTVPVTFTVVVGSDFMEAELDRSKLHNVQLPQLFRTEVLMNAHKRAIKDSYVATEDGMLVFHYGGEVKFVPGRDSNVKVTTVFDVEIAEKLLVL